MLRFKTEFFDTDPLSKYRIAVTSNRLWIEVKTSNFLDSKEYRKVLYINFDPGGKYVDPYFFARGLHESWLHSEETIEDMIKKLNDRFNIEIPKEAVELFESRVLAGVMTND